MIEPNIQPPYPASVRRRGRFKSPILIVLAVFALLLIPAAFAIASYGKRERLRLIVLRNLVDEAAAPNETVLTDDWLIYKLLRWKGSPALREQLFLLQGVFPTRFKDDQEIIIVSTQTSTLRSQLTTSHYILTPDVAQTRWITSGLGLSIPGRGVVTIDFATPATPPLSNNIGANR